MKLSAIATAVALALLPGSSAMPAANAMPAVKLNAAAASASPTCIPSAPMKYQAMAMLQYTAVNNANIKHPYGIDVGKNSKTNCGGHGTDTTNSGYTMACGCALNKNSPAVVTPQSLSYALGLILGACGGKNIGGQVVIDNVVYGFY